jgi:hypothetical protein
MPLFLWLIHFLGLQSNQPLTVFQKDSVKVRKCATIKKKGCEIQKRGVHALTGFKEFAVKNNLVLKGEEFKY